MGLGLMSNPTPVEVPRHLLREAYRQARNEFPAECCGWMAGADNENSVSNIRECVNMQEQGQHPTAPERLPETAFVIGGQDLIELNQSFDSDNPARIIYHSHPNGLSYLSETDRGIATSPWGDGPAYPVQQLVIGIDAEQIVDAALFDWSESTGGFVEIARFSGERF
ncbi:MAG: Mov34/MPN/PAD-1 family protein [SAR202 cluster bacterium]|nr:Mov34/MPN/PAD-1 family protein [SAR202 cluster bacterium]